jgi:hypothetical protein
MSEVICHLESPAECRRDSIEVVSMTVPVSSWITPKARKGIRSDIAGRGLGYFSWYLQRKIDDAG